MNTTKKKILEASLELFNRNGLTKVSQRKITEYLTISPGNLTYHFKKKEDIVTTLYFELVALFDTYFQRLEKQEFDLSELMSFTEKMFDCIYTYRFIFLDFVYLVNTHPKIAEHYKGLLTIRKQQFGETIQYLVKQKIFRAEELPLEYDNLYNRIHLITDFYLSSVAITKDKEDKNYKEDYKNMIFYSMYPYLTEQGKDILKGNI